MIYVVRNDELYHHGIKGQKWGVRNGPPYPLSRETVGSIETKKCVEMVTGFGPVAIAACVSVAAVTIPKVINNAVRKQYMSELDDMKNDSTVKKLTDLPRLKNHEHPTEAVKVVNPGYPGKGSIENCLFCTTAMAMRQQGYDVAANITKHPWYAHDLFEKVWNAAPELLDQTYSLDKKFGTIASHGDGSYGAFNAMGHSMFWINERGKIRIFDGQDGTECDTSFGSKFMDRIKDAYIEYYRLDNKKPTDYALAIVKPR